MRRVLIVTSSYCPTMIADIHRARHLAWELPKLGWEVEVLAPGGAFQHREYFDPEAAPFFNPEVACHFVEPRDAWYFKLLGMRSMSWRALRPLYRAGAELLRQKKFDVIYITTGKFNLFCLGRLWRGKYGVPYVLDFHDPWVKEGISYQTTGNSFKRRLAQWLALPMEAFAVRSAAGLVSVSPIYLEELRRRYGARNGLSEGRCVAVPFGGSERDLVSGAKCDVIGDRSTFTVAYVGAGGSIMAKSFKTVCEALAKVRERQPDLVEGLRFRILGTYAFWKPGDPKPLVELAERLGVGDLVDEIPPWISYSQTMMEIQRGDALLILGVDDAGYVPSKLFTYALTGKPLLACMRADSPTKEFFRLMPGLGHLLTFGAASDSGDAADIVADFLSEMKNRMKIDRRKLIADYLAPAMAARHAALFERICPKGEPRC